MMSVLKLRNQDLLIDHASPTVAVEETSNQPVYPPGRYYPAYHHPAEVKLEPEPLMAWDDSDQVDDVQVGLIYRDPLGDNKDLNPILNPKNMIEHKNVDG